MTTVLSKNKVPIRVPEERWLHITEEHSELAGYYFDVLEAVQDPIFIYKGNSGELLAGKKMEDNKYLIVIYKEIAQDDGFIITAFLTKRIVQIERREKIWPLN